MRKKKNHYVPKFYLKNFSDDPQSKAGKVDLFNIKGLKYIGIVPYGSQMQEDYFYSKDNVLEDRLDNEYEKKHAVALSELLTGKNTDANLLIEILLLMYFRTRSRRDNEVTSRKVFIDTNLDYLTSNFVSFFKKQYFGLGRIFLYFLPKHQIEKIVKEGAYKEYLNQQILAERNIETFERLNEEMEGLNVVILKNNNSLNLLSSDHPVLLLNPFLYERVRNFGIKGFKQSGIIVLLPADPNHLIVCYDPDVYDCNESNKISKNDVVKINRLEAFVAEEAVFTKRITEESLDQIKKDVEKRVSPEHVVLKLGGGYEMYYQDDKLPNYHFSFLTIKSEAKKTKLNIPYARKIAGK